MSDPTQNAIEFELESCKLDFARNVFQNKLDTYPMSETNNLRTIGPRIRAARQAMRWTQARLSEALGFNDRQTLSDIENGKRMVKPQELVTISECLQRDIDYFLDPFSVAGEAKYNWRAAPEVPSSTLDSFESQADRWIGLLRWLHQQHKPPSPLKLNLRLGANASFEQAQACAQALVVALELGHTPAIGLANAIQSKLDIDILFVDTISAQPRFGISGATCHLPDMTVILINRQEPVCRQYFDMAHELFHALTWDAMEPAHRESNRIEQRKGSKRIEQLADNFAAALLMPQSSLEHLIKTNQRSNLAHLTRAAKALQVAPSALAWRLFNLSWIDAKTLQLLKAQPNKSSQRSMPKRFSDQYMTMLYEAIDQGQLSARKACKTLGMSLPELKTLFKEHALPVPFEI